MLPGEVLALEASVVCVFTTVVMIGAEVLLALGADVFGIARGVI